MPSDSSPFDPSTSGAIPAPGVMAVDWEERVNFDRLRSYRIARVREALERSELGALVLFDMNNIRYLTATHIGEWARDKAARYALITRSDADPMVGARREPTEVEDVEELDVFLVCRECGTEFRVTRLGELQIPRHCGEPMDVVRRPAV